MDNAASLSLDIKQGLYDIVIVGSDCFGRYKLPSHLIFTSDEEDKIRSVLDDVTHKEQGRHLGSVLSIALSNCILIVCFTTFDSKFESYTVNYGWIEKAIKHLKANLFIRHNIQPDEKTLNVFIHDIAAGGSGGDPLFIREIFTRCFGGSHQYHYQMINTRNTCEIQTFAISVSSEGNISKGHKILMKSSKYTKSLIGANKSHHYVMDDEMVNLYSDYNLPNIHIVTHYPEDWEDSKLKIKSIHADPMESLLSARDVMNEEYNNDPHQEHNPLNKRCIIIIGGTELLKSLDGLYNTFYHVDVDAYNPEDVSKLLSGELEEDYDLPVDLHLPDEGIYKEGISQWGSIREGNYSIKSIINRYHHKRLTKSTME